MSAAEHANNWDDQLASLRRLAAAHDAHTVVLRDPLNLSWFTGARWHVPQTLNMSCFDVVVSGLAGPQGSEEVRIITNAIEAPRLRDTEFAGRPVEFDTVDWTEDRSTLLPAGPGVLTDQPGGTGAGSLDAQAALAAIRRILTPSQQHTLTGLCADLARITGGVVSAIRPGESEQHIAGQLVATLLEEGIETVALFVGADERIGAHRHPLATAQPVRDRVMVACCGRRDGLVGTITRMASFSALDTGAYDALLRVEQVFLDNSTPGAELGSVFTLGASAYGENGFDSEEWRRHHQGGLTGFNPRELIANPGTDVQLAEGMVLGWNPSGAGFKVEDTVLVTAGGPRILTIDDTWPAVSVGGRPRPAVLEIH